ILPHVWYAPVTTFVCDPGALHSWVVHPLPYLAGLSSTCTICGVGNEEYLSPGAYQPLHRNGCSSHGVISSLCAMRSSVLVRTHFQDRLRGKNEPRRNDRRPSQSSLRHQTQGFKSKEWT